MEAYERFYDPKVLARISRLEMRAKMVVEGAISGMHRSPYHGQSVEFADHRAYVPGDDPRHIDWKVYGRAGRFVTKRYEEETNLRAHLLLDCSESMRYGEGASRSRGTGSKYEYGATLAASLAYLFHRQHDAAGVTLFDSRVRSRVPLSTSTAVLRWIGEALGATEPRHKTDLAAVLGEIAAGLPRRGLVVLISDLFAPREAIARALEGFSLRGHDIMVFHVLHETELSFPFEGNLLFQGLEEYPDVPAEARAVRDAYLAVVREYLDEVERIASRLGVDYHRAHTGEPLEAAVIAVAAARSRRRRRP